jgi:beta-mannosidase
VTVRPGLQVHEIVVPVEEPPLWWPIGLGPQNLAGVQWSLSAGGQNYGQGLRRVGFRHVNVDQPEDPEGGRRFIVRVNGRPVFCKGANWVPADMVMSRTEDRRYQQLVDLAVEANFNFLRVWGGGLYETDDFYEACDERGILVWQEFIFACSRYPTTDPEFLADVRMEATHQVRRLAHHPSLVVWCGNNENEWGAWDWGFEKGVALPDHALYHTVLPRILAAEDPSRFYQPSSPWSPDGSHPNADHVGDQHPWSVGFANRDFRDYRRMAGRFPNEGGVLGPTSLPTMRQCLGGGPEEVGSFAWRIHDNVNGPHADAMVEEWLGLDPYALSVEEYTYWAGLVQGEGLREYCDNFRRRMYATSSAIFWMYNDCWPATRSWTVVDYNLRRTPAFAPVRRAMAPVSVVVAEDGDRIGVFGVNDTDCAVRGRLRFGVLAIATSDYVLDRCSDVELAPNASTLLAEIPRAELRDPRTTAAFAMLEDGGSLVSRGRLFLPRYHEIAWPEAEVRVRVENGEAVFESDSFAWGVCIDLDGDRPLADNFFDVWPGIPHRLPWSEARAPRVLHVGNALRGTGRG